MVGAERRVRTDDDDGAARVEAVHERQQRGHDAVVDLVLLAAAHLRTHSQRSSPVRRSVFACTVVTTSSGNSYCVVEPVVKDQLCPMTSACSAGMPEQTRHAAHNMPGCLGHAYTWW